MYKSDHYKKSSKAYDYASTFLLLVIPSIIAIILLLRYICVRVNSGSRHVRTFAPRFPPWLIGNLCEPKLREAVTPLPFFVYTKDYNRQSWTNRRNIEPKEMNILHKMRKMLGNIYGITVDWQIFPDTSCIVSMPKMNFQSGFMPGTFVPIHGGPPDDSHFEYEMIGDYRIQATYYIVGGVEYVAGLCIYIENPYQETTLYNESVIRKLMKKPEYWSTYDLKEETLHIVKRELSQRPQIAVTNKYGEEFGWNYADEDKSWQPYGKHSKARVHEVEQDEDPKIQSQFLSVKMCSTQQEMVMIAEKNGKKVHVDWNKNTREMDFSHCETCNSCDDPPPEYSSTVRKKIVYDGMIW